jgi:hypothetical protein
MEVSWNRSNVPHARKLSRYQIFPPKLDDLDRFIIDPTVIHASMTKKSYLAE